MFDKPVLLRTLVIVLSRLFLIGGITGARAQLHVAPPANATALAGQTVMIAITLSNPGAQAVDAFGMKLTFPAALLEYDTLLTAGTLTAGWVAANGNQTGANEITLGGFHTTPITGSGVLCNLRFTAKPGVSGKDSLRLRSFADDLAAAATTDGVVEILTVTVFTAILNGDQVVPPVSTPGKGQITATLTGNQLVVSGDFSDLSSGVNVMILGSAFLQLAPAGRNGDLQFELFPVLDTGRRSGRFEAASNTFTLNDEQIAALNARKLYANILTVDHLNGEIRGQLAPAADALYRANLAGSNEVPAVNSAANGAVLLELRGNELAVTGSFQELGSDLNFNVGGAHLHLAPAGRNGGIQFNLFTAIDHDGRGGVFEAARNTFVLSGDQLAALRARRLYVNVHSLNFPGGEIRGQIVPQRANAFRANLSGGNEVPPVATTGAGALTLELVGNQLTVTGAFDNLAGDFDAGIAGGAHLHLSPAGLNGGIQIPLVAAADANLRGGVFEAASNTVVLSNDQVTALRARKLYANIHTTFAPAGEVRGQVLPENYSFFSAVLSGRHEVQPLPSTGRGAVIAELSGTRLIVTGSFSDLSSDFNPAIRGGAHLHAAPAGQNGGIQIELATALGVNARSGAFEAADNAFALTADQASALRAGEWYANVHTQVFTGGEVRGQLLHDPNRFPNATNITAPLSGGTVVIEGRGDQLFHATWNATIDPDYHRVVYIWQLSPDRQFNALLSNRNTGIATVFSARYSAIDSMLAAAGVAVNQTIKLYHRANTSDGSLQSFGGIDSVNIRRGIVTAVAEREEAPPAEFALHGNYPNPFNPSTLIRYDLPYAVNVKLAIYNALGEKIRTLVDGLETPGIKYAIWDGRNEAGRHAASGVYVYRLEAGGFAASRTLTLMK